MKKCKKMPSPNIILFSLIPFIAIAIIVFACVFSTANTEKEIKASYNISLNGSDKSAEYMEDISYNTNKVTEITTQGYVLPEGLYRVKTENKDGSCFVLTTYKNEGKEKVIDYDSFNNNIFVPYGGYVYVCLSEVNVVMLSDIEGVMTPCIFEQLS